MRRFLTCVAIVAAGCVPAEIRQVRTQAIASDFVFVSGGGGNSAILVRDRKALVFDPKMWPYEGSVLEVLKAAGATASIVVDSHAHLDHVGANSAHPGARIIAAAATQEELASTGVGARVPGHASVPTVPVRSRLVLSFGGERVELVHPGPAHTSGDLFAWFPARRILVTGDLFDNGYYPHIDAARGGTFLGYLAAVEKLCEYDAALVIPGHGPLATKAELTAHRDFLRGLRDSVARELKAGTAAPDAIEKLAPRGEEKLAEMGSFSNRRDIVEALVTELTR